MALLMDAPPNGTTNGTMGEGGGMSGDQSDLGSVPAILAVTFTLTVTMIVVLVARIYIRLRAGVQSLRLVDWMHVLACFVSVAVSVAVVIGVRYGMGRHKFTITGPETTQGLKWYWISKILYIIATWIVKMAVFNTLLLIASAPPQQARKSLKRMLYCAMIFMTCYTVVFWIGTVIECRPVRVIWDKTGMQERQCLPGNLVKGISNGHAAMNTATDVFYFLVAIFMVIYGVRRPMREKLALIGVFVLALFSVAAAAVHALYEFGYQETGELLFDDSNLAIWAVVEINVGLVAINLPSLSPFFQKFLRPQRSPIRSSSSHNSPSTPTPSTLLTMTNMHKETLRRSESQRNMVNDHPSYHPPARPFAVQSSQRFSSDSKSNLSEIMTLQVDVDIEQHPAFREPVIPQVVKPQQAAAPGGMGHRRKQTPMIF